jgi:hypothetical protein
LTVSYFKSLFLKSFNNFRFSIFLIKSKMTFCFMESDVWWKYVLIFQQSLLNVFEWNSLLFFDTNGENDRLYFFIWVLSFNLIVISFDFFLRFIFGKIVECFSSNHGFISIKLKLIVSSYSINNLLNFIDAKFFNLVTV